MFNADKTLEEYKQTPLFLGAKPGLFDTINKQYPKIWDLYKEMKVLDWSEDEFDYSQCNIDFKNCPKDVADIMIRTLAWQWEADSVASQSIVAAFAPFVTNSELWAAWGRISDNEVLHSLNYSEIVRMSFDNPKEVLGQILSVKESLERLESVGKIFKELSIKGKQYGLGLIEADQDLYNSIYVAVCTMLILERLQFMASFAITFSIADSGVFQPIGQAVRKICTDELTVHAELDKEIIRIENKTERGVLAKHQTKEQVKKVFLEVIASEIKWSEYLFDGRQLAGVNSDVLKQWVLFNAKDVARFLEIETDLEFPKENPMPWLENWIDINKQQAAPQEQDLAQYKVNNTFNDDQEVNFDVDF